MIYGLNIYSVYIQYFFVALVSNMYYISYINDFAVLYKVFKYGIIICLLGKKILLFAVSTIRNTNWNPSNMLGFFHV